MKCRDCAYWERDRYPEPKPIDDGVGRIRYFSGKCRSYKWVKDDGGEVAEFYFPPDGIVYWGGGSLAGFMTGEDFGCIHFERVKRVDM